jgi:hypothetical protein
VADIAAGTAGITGVTGGIASRARVARGVGVCRSVPPRSIAHAPGQRRIEFSPMRLRLVSLIVALFRTFCAAWSG